MTLSQARPICFIATADATRARAFYAETLGLTFLSDEPWALVFDLGGTMLRIQKAQPFTPHPFTALGWQVPDIAATVAALTARGVEALRFPWMQQDGGIWEAPGGARVAWFKDPDGNILSVTQFP